MAKKATPPIRQLPCGALDIPPERLKELLQAPSAQPRAAIDVTKLWGPRGQGVSLTVAILNGSSSVRGRVKDVLQNGVPNISKTWPQVANIDFQFVNSSGAQVRISIGDGGGHRSVIGRDSATQSVGPSGASMNVDLTDAHPDEEYCRVVLHEMGHALGLIHEHQSPNASIQWNEQAVIQYFGGPPNNWAPQKTIDNVIRRANILTTNATEFDPDSIMLYGFPASLTTDGIGTHFNSSLSALDIQHIRLFYGARGGDVDPGPKPEEVTLPVPSEMTFAADNGQTRRFRFSIVDADFYDIAIKAKGDVVAQLFGPDSDSTKIDEQGPSANPLIAGHKLEEGNYFLRVKPVDVAASFDYLISVK